MIASFYEAWSVLQCASFALALFLTLTVYALSVKGDIEFLGGIVSCLATLSLTFGIFVLFTGSEFMFTLYCWIGLIATCVYTIYDV